MKNYKDTSRLGATLRELKKNGGWPFGVNQIVIDCDCRVFFDNICLRRFIDPEKIKELRINDVIIKPTFDILNYLNDHD